MVAVALIGAGCASPSLCEGEAAPGTITEMVEHLNTLPRPVTVACLLDSLERPLAIEATTNPFSAQPADGPRSPRTFVFQGDLSISIVPAGVGSEVVEFGETTGPLETIKAELAFPVKRELLLSDPHTKIGDADSGTICSVCHLEERAVDLGDAGVGWTSVGLKPDDESLMSIDLLAEQADRCRPSEEPERCDVLSALFDGEVVHQPFPAAYPTIFDLTPEE